MMAQMSKIMPCLWFDSQAEEAASHYVSIFARSGIDGIVRYGKEGFEHHRRPEGSVMTVAFHLEGQSFTALNGGPLFKFSEAISLQVLCDDQEEIDRLWSRLSEGGSEGRCGWLKDKFGLSWQIVPSVIPTMMLDADSAKVARVTRAFMPMAKLDIATIERAYRGE
jgi:predicted 3-demethylubiquinone-9 3-methyltransferase (glyoxalase superfamily)